MDEFLRLSGVHAHYGESHILHGVDLTVRKGEVVTLLGRNGAGRTTTLKAILGLVGRRTGSILESDLRHGCGFVAAPLEDHFYVMEHGQIVESFGAA